MSWYKTKRTIAKEKKLKFREQKIDKLIDSLLNTEGHEIHISPLTDEFFIIDRKNQVYLSIMDSTIKVSNHDYLFEVNLTLAKVEQIKDSVRKKVHTSVESIKKSLFKNQIELLEKLNSLYVDKEE